MKNRASKMSEDSRVMLTPGGGGTGWGEFAGIVRVWDER
jgi:hypothetical protein